MCTHEEKQRDAGAPVAECNTAPAPPVLHCAHQNGIFLISIDNKCLGFLNLLALRGVKSLIFMTSEVRFHNLVHTQGPSLDTTTPITRWGLSKQEFNSEFNLSDLILPS